MEAMEIVGVSHEKATMGMPKGSCSLPLKKRARLTAPEGAIEVLKKAKVEAHTDADSDSDSDCDSYSDCHSYTTEELYSDWLKCWNEFTAKENTEDQPGGNKESLPEGVYWSCVGIGDDYQNLVVCDDRHLYKDKYEGCTYMLENEEQRAYLKFYYQLCKEVKLGADHAECEKKAYSLTGDLSRDLIPLVIEDRMHDLQIEQYVNIRDSVYCYLWDEVVLKKRVYASVAAEIGEKYPMHVEDIMEDASGKCDAKFFLKELEDRIDASMPSEDAHEQIKKVCDEEWPMKYMTFAGYLELKILVAEKLGILPKELQGLLQELHDGVEN